MAVVQGQNDSVVPTRRIAGPRALLPFEVELCETLGITAEEYLYFQALSEAYNGTRAKEYDLAGVPDVRNDPVSIIVSLVIGIAMSAIGMLLAPKPKKQNTPPNLKTSDQQGAKRFLQGEGFSGIQEPAVLGQTIPIVFAKRSGSTGGVRVNAMLLWSQLLSRGTGQQLKAAMLLSMGQLAARPDFVGIAIGDQTLKNYTNSKIGLYYRPYGGRLSEGDRYPEGTIEADPQPGDILSVFANTAGGWQPWFSATRTPSTQTQFGLYQPMPNSSIFRVPYELVMTGKDASGEQRAADQRKREKIAAGFPTFAGFYQADSSWLVPGQNCAYALVETEQDKNGYSPWGLDDVNASTEDMRVTADEQIQVGDSYMAGGALVVCNWQEYADPWAIGKRKHFNFRCLEAGPLGIANLWLPQNPPYGWVLQRVALATIANSRDCDITELGIKSTVWRQIAGFPNVNSEPDDATINYYQNANGMISLGTINRHVRRMSFFRLEWRKLGETGDWRDLSGGALFYVEGRTPTAQYNYIRIEHDRGQYEFRLKPYPGAWVYAGWRSSDVYELTGDSSCQFWQDGLSVSFSGRRINLSSVKLTNPDWYRKGEAGTWVTQTVTKWAFAKSNFYYTRTPYPGLMFLGIGGTYSYDYINRSGQWVTANYVNGWPVVLGVEYSNQYPPMASIAEIFSGVRKQKFYRGAARAVVNTAPGTFGQTVVVYEIQVWHYKQVTETVHVPAENLNPFDVIADYKLYDSEESSHFNGPEHEVVYVNEQLKQSPVQYDELSYLGLRLNSTKEWSSFQQLSAYIKQGVIIERLVDDTGNPVAEGVLSGPSNNLAEIVYTLLVDKRLGAGAAVGRKAVSRERMQQAARWCHANGFTWDGVLGEGLNLRQWIFEQAGYALLDFTILGGQFSLVPSFPHTADYAIDRTASPKISALFTDGNIRDLKVAWLSPEERQPFKAVVNWRQETENGFSRKRSLAIRLSDGQGGSDRDAEEDFDLSEFCTSVSQARTFARVALKLRKEVRHGLSFQTTPQAAMGLEPGAYFRLVSEVTHTSRFNNGSIGKDGKINTVEGVPDGQHNILYWEPGTEGVKEATITVSNNTCTDEQFWGTVFTVANTATNSRVYKVESISYGDEGWVTVSGSHQPLTGSGSLAVLDWDDSHFVEEGM